MSYLHDLRAHAKSIRKMHGSERSPMQRAVFVLDGEICRDEATIKELDTKNAQMLEMQNALCRLRDEQKDEISRLSSENSRYREAIRSALNRCGYAGNPGYVEKTLQDALDVPVSEVTTCKCG